MGFYELQSTSSPPLPILCSHPYCLESYTPPRSLPRAVAVAREIAVVRPDVHILRRVVRVRLFDLSELAPASSRRSSGSVDE